MVERGVRTILSLISLYFALCMRTWRGMGALEFSLSVLINELKLRPIILSDA